MMDNFFKIKIYFYAICASYIFNNLENKLQNLIFLKNEISIYKAKIHNDISVVVLKENNHGKSIE